MGKLIQLSLIGFAAGLMLACGFIPLIFIGILIHYLNIYFPI